MSDLTDVNYTNTVPYVPLSERRGLKPFGKWVGTDSRVQTYLGAAAGELFNGTLANGSGYQQNIFAGGGNDLIGAGPVPIWRSAKRAGTRCGAAPKTTSSMAATATTTRPTAQSRR